MKTKWSWLTFIAIVAMTIFVGSSFIYACPKCRTAAGDLGDFLNPENLSAKTDQQGNTDTNRSWLHGSAGVEFTSAYIFHGFVEADQGLIAQPFLTFAPGRFEPFKDIHAEPYITWSNTLLDTSNGTINHQHGAAQQLINKEEQYLDPGHPGDESPHYHTRNVVALDGADGKYWYDSRILAGTLITIKDLYIDLKYQVCFYPDGSHDTVQEIGGKIVYDIAGLWKKKADRSYSILPFGAVMRETDDDNSNGLQTYIEYGVEARWHGIMFGQSVGVSLPLTISASPDGYFIDSLAEDQWLGSWSIGPTVTWELPLRSERFRTFLNVSARYQHFEAFNARVSNGDESDLWIGSAGFAVAF